jgi:hypothetical protein
MKSKAQQFHNTPIEAQRGRRYSSYSFTNLALYVVSGQSYPRPCFTLGEKSNYRYEKIEFYFKRY